MADSADAESGKCFSALLRRLLCRGSLPTHPSDQFIELNTKEVGDHQKSENMQKPDVAVKQYAAASPGVVARLMGLDSFPDTPLYPRDRTLGSYFRSRSANSIDFFSKFDLTIKEGRQQHRRVLTSVSFREGLNEDYGVVLRLEKVDEAGGYEEECPIKINMPKVNHQQLKKERGKFQEKSVDNKPSKKLETEEQRRLVCGKYQKKDFHGKSRVNLKERRPIIKPVDSKEALSGSKSSVKKKKNVISACKVPNSDRHRLKKMHPKATIPEMPPAAHSRKTLASHNSNPKRSYSNRAHCDDEKVRAIVQGEDGRKLKNDESCYYRRMVEEICRLTKEDVEDNWMHGKLADFEETCQQFGQEILEVLIKQFVDELVIL